MQPDISVIVTVYNVKKYLKQCVDSIVNQTLKNVEIILVDDGSTDGSEDICDSYNYDERLIIIHQTNCGVMRARKTGISCATAPLVTWVDGDDWLERDFLEKLLWIYEETKADVISTSVIIDIGSQSSLQKNAFPAGLYSSEEIEGKMLYYGEFFVYGVLPYLWSKLIRRDIMLPFFKTIENIVSIGDDVGIVYPSILASKSIFITDLHGYHYVQHESSLTHRFKRSETDGLRSLLKYLKSWLGMRNIKQLIQYEKYIMFMQLSEECDNESTLMKPFGGIKETDKVILYGAGRVGKKIYLYLKEKRINIVEWLDKNFEFYREQGFNVNALTVAKDEKEYDVILIANMTYSIAAEIWKDLENAGYPSEKIRWFSEEWLSTDYVCEYLLQ